MSWFQHEVKLPEYPRGFHLITDHILDAAPEIGKVRAGLLHLFLMHTSAALSINENADRDVALDLQTAFDEMAPEDDPYRHTCEGPDDMPAHIKTSLLDSSLTIPVQAGRLCLGTWQGVFLCEHRNRGGRRRLVITLNGECAE